MNAAPALSFVSSPPTLCSQEAEEAVIGGLLLDNRYVVDVLATVKSSDFFLLRLRWILDAIAALHERKVAIDIITVADELEARKKLADVGGTSYLAQIMSSAGNPANIETYARIVQDKAFRRRLLGAADKIKVLALETEKPLTSVRAGVEQALDETSADEKDEDISTLHNLISEYYDVLEKSADVKDGVSGLASGLKDWDNLTDGMQPGSLNYVAGRPGMGKTSLLLAIALNVAQHGGRVYLWSGEMPKKQIRERLTSIHANITGTHLRRGLRPGGMTQEEWARFVNSAGELSKLPIYIDDQTAVTPSFIESRCTRLARRVGPLALIIVDYINLMESERKFENREKELTYISRKLKQMAGNAPVLCASQLSRACENRADKRPMLPDLRDSGSLEQDADTVTFIYRDEVYNAETTAPNRAELIVAKNRHGSIGTASLYFEKLYTKFLNGAERSVDLSKL